MAGFVRAAAVASAPAPDLAPDFALPPAGGDWMARAETIARAVAASLKARAALPERDWSRLPCFVGSSSHFIGAREARPDAPLGPPAEFARTLARWFGVGEPAIAVNTACTSGLTALGLAADLVAAGAWPHVLVLGVELVNRLTGAGFAALQLLSRDRARPCDRARDGLALGEALGAVIVSASGAWRIAALASEVDPSGIAAPAPNEATIGRVLRAALSQARWRAEEVDLLKLQAGGSPLGDLAEARALRAVFAPVPRCVSLKGAIGHTLGASGPAELALLLESLARGRVPATQGFANVDAEVGLAPAGGDGSRARRVLFNLAGFGGHVASLALEKAA